MTVLTSPEQVTATYLTDRLRENDHMDRGEVVAVGIEDKLKDDRETYRLKIDYSLDASADLPWKLIFKYNTNGCKKTRAPHYCAAVREALFYEEIVATMPDPPVAQCYDTGVDFDTGEAYTLVEDLSGRYYVTPASATPSPYGGWHNFDNLPAEQFGQIVAALARIQAYWWDHERLGEQTFSESTGDMLSMVDTASEEWVEDRLHRPEGKGEVARDLRYHGESDAEGALALSERAMRAWPALCRRRLEAGKGLTFMHVDFHLRNVLLPRDPETHGVSIHDWEGLARGVGVTDLAHLLATSMLPAPYWRALEEPLLARYHAALVAGGVEGYSLDDCRDDYRLSLVALMPQAFGGGPFHRSVLSAFRAWDCEELL